MDGFTSSHLDAWLTGQFGRDTFGQYERLLDAKLAIVRFVEEHPDVLNRTWSDILDLATRQL